MLLATLVRNVPYVCNLFIIQTTVATIINYNRNSFIVQATGTSIVKPFIEVINTSVLIPARSTLA
jgi:hypothetical protein